MADAIKVANIKAFVQENGIIREDSTGLFLGRLDGVTFEQVSALAVQTETHHGTGANISPLSPEEIKEIEERANKATPGPWMTKPGGAKYEGFSLDVLIAATAPTTANRVYATPPGGHFPAADQEFIAKAREDIPRLIATIRDLQQQLAAYRDAGHTETVTVEGEVRCKLCGAVDMPRMAITRDTTGKPDGFRCWPKCESGPTGAPESQ